MSTTVDIIDPVPFDKGIGDVRSDVSPINWMVAGHVSMNPNVLGFRASGCGGLEEMATHLNDDEAMYALVRLQEKVDLSSTVKFVYIHWVGESVPFTKKGRYGVVHGSIKEKIGQYHCIVETSSKADLTEEAIMKILMETSGTKSMVMEKSEAATRMDRGFTSSSNIIKTGKQARGVQVPDAIAMIIGSSVMDAIAEVRSDEHPINWCVAVYEGNNPKLPIILGGKGSGGLPEMASCMKEDYVSYALLRVTDIVDQISTVKFVFIQWIGESVKPMTKGKISTHKPTMQKVFGVSFHLVLWPFYCK
ncbi:predicted protein [Nematostella vectensis]|uniref:Coactosin-like protein n=1 Tax=Nematostella vectensis TaxID=45351 RepID=A7RMX1_NEMVE|nr:predicted protein [Nematostella vectensis]|eukprot:XP_001639283.1 predicted protein [Nematostella vectensis]